MSSKFSRVMSSNCEFVLLLGFYRDTHVYTMLRSNITHM